MISRETFHNVVLGAAILGAIVVLRWGKSNATPTGVSMIETAATVAPSAWNGLPKYVKYNMPAWGPRMQPFISMPNSSPVTMDLGAGGDEAYGGFYSN